MLHQIDLMTSMMHWSTSLSNLVCDDRQRKNRLNQLKLRALIYLHVWLFNVKNQNFNAEWPRIDRKELTEQLGTSISSYNSTQTKKSVKLIQCLPTEKTTCLQFSVRNLTKLNRIKRTQSWQHKANKTKSARTLSKSSKSKFQKSFQQ